MRKHDDKRIELTLSQKLYEEFLAFRAVEEKRQRKYVSLNEIVRELIHDAFVRSK
jgi:hypothetical protein